MHTKFILTTVFILFGLIQAIALDSKEDRPPLMFSIGARRSIIEVGERTHHRLKIMNVSSQTVTIPSFGFSITKEEDSSVAYYLKKKILLLKLMKDGQEQSMKEAFRNPPNFAYRFPTIALKPGETKMTQFSLSRKYSPVFYDMPTPGEYTIIATFDTTGVDDDKILKGKFKSNSFNFTIIPERTFREEKPGESRKDYSRRKVHFYLTRIVKHEGEYFTNVQRILKTEGGIPALIQNLSSKKDEIARLAHVLLGQFHHPHGFPNEPPLPSTVAEWEDWWDQKGSKLSIGRLWANFDGCYP